MNDNFEINGLDHIALIVKDMKRSIEWYEEVLGLKKYQLEKWGAYPIFMLAGKSGIALFPASRKAPLTKKNEGRKVDHFAFNVSAMEFEKAKQKFLRLGLKYDYQDHHYFDSIYIKDPDNNTVELTTLKAAEEDFYT